MVGYHTGIGNYQFNMQNSRLNLRILRAGGQSMEALITTLHPPWCSAPKTLLVEATATLPALRLRPGYPNVTYMKGLRYLR